MLSQIFIFIFYEKIFNKIVYFIFKFIIANKPIINLNKIKSK